MSLSKILIATGNKGKYREIKEELAKIGVEAVSLQDANVTLERPEIGETYDENARIKAEEGYDKTGLPSLADDSGLEVDYLDGDPGIHSDRWAGDDVTVSERNQLLLEKLEGVPKDERTARFICDMVLFDDTGQRFTTHGTCEGRIALQPRGDRGFGYDPIFEVEARDYRTFGELTPRVKQRISHRALALASMMENIKQT
ncbi:MAG: RdgB/HAM1 family non-canonical purine NTP pyrophosphatase [bacterium]